MSNTYRHLAIVGVTASGKSSLAFQFAQNDDELEIVSVDSMQVYRGMDIGTAKPTLEEQAQVPHHMIDLAEPTEDYGVSQFQTEMRAILADIEARNKTAVLVGGTGLYMQAIVDGLTIPPTFPNIREELEARDVETNYKELADLDPQAAEKMQSTNQRRIVRALEVVRGTGRKFSSFGPGMQTFPPTPFRMIGLWRSREEIVERIRARYEQQFREGFIDEVRALADRPLSRTASYALGYRELLAHVRGEISENDAMEEAIVRTKSFARRQRMWFRRDPRITWLGLRGEMDRPIPTEKGAWREWLN